MRNVTKSNPERDFIQFYVKMKKVCRCFASFSSEQNHFTHGMYMTSLIHPSDVKKNRQIMFYDGINAKVFRCSIAFAIVIVVTSRSSAFEYTMSVHAVHTGTERNVFNIIVSTETPQTTTNPSQTLLPVYKLAHLPLPHPKSSSLRPPQPLAQPFAQMHYRCKYQVSSTSPNILEVYTIYLHGDMCLYMRFCHLSHLPRLRLASALLKFHQNFHVLL